MNARKQALYFKKEIVIPDKDFTMNERLVICRTINTSINNEKEELNDKFYNCDFISQILSFYFRRTICVTERRNSYCVKVK